MEPGEFLEERDRASGAGVEPWGPGSRWSTVGRVCTGMSCPGALQLPSPAVCVTTLQGFWPQGPMPLLLETLLWPSLVFRMKHKLLHKALKLSRPSALPLHQLEPSGHCKSVSFCGLQSSSCLCWNTLTYPFFSLEAST